MQLILASSSSFRKAQLEKLGLPFSQVSPDVDETKLDQESLPEMVLRLGIKKAQAVARLHPDALIIASDQGAQCGQHILCKPGNHQNACNQLMMMSGQSVFFYTSLVLLNAQTGQAQTDTIRTEVKFRTLDQQQIENYLNRDKPYQCAGSFKSEALGVALFESVESTDPDALIGLPLIHLVKFLANEGKDPLSI
ncbi:MAG: septum formation protein Maf [Gammaproteobacteria bacterium CG22_combo_CG10-13_8_21_14_all_40_8]|nr:MAG: septum formation protein Maf [Gammaproteobacteria bacterium CG22_combo_CG10-13_8_21_14_all_40_8]